MEISKLQILQSAKNEDMVSFLQPFQYFEHCFPHQYLCPLLRGRLLLIVHLCCKNSHSLVNFKLLAIVTLVDGEEAERAVMELNSRRQLHGTSVNVSETKNQVDTTLPTITITINTAFFIAV